VLSVPVALAVDVHAEPRPVRAVALAEWLELPADHQAPRAAVATCDLQDGALTILITDAHTQEPVMLVEGEAGQLGAFAAAFAASVADVDVRAIFWGVLLPRIDVKVGGGTGPGPGPKVPDPTHVAYGTALAGVVTLRPVMLAPDRR
jgi:hypothetical protein